MLIPEILRDLADSTSMDLAATEEEQNRGPRAAHQRPGSCSSCPGGPGCPDLPPSPFRHFLFFAAGILVVAIGPAVSLLASLSSPGWLDPRMNRGADQYGRGERSV